MTTAFRIFSTMVVSLPLAQEKGQIRWAEIHEVDYHPEGRTLEIVVCFEDHSQTSHSFTFFEDEAVEAMTVAYESPFFR